jgi:methyl-accepting chemotaxis protein
MLKEVEQLRAGYLSSRDQISALKKAGNAEEASKVLEKVFIPASATFIKK